MAKATDPVCGMEADTSSQFKSEHMGKTYYFCSAQDKAEFDKHPMKYHAKEVAESVTGRK
jgi:YHS domain-containing protein